MSRRIDRLSIAVGQWVSWLVLVAVLVSAGNAVIRKVFDTSSNAWLELQWYLFGAVFMLAAAYTLERNEHIRIDIVSSMLSKRTRDWIDILGHACMLLPLTMIMGYLCFIFFWNSYASGEISGSAGGLILWPARLAIFLGFALLFLQGLSELVKRIAVMQGLIPEPHARSSHHGADDGART
jgi:TRAP-type mannitol/chloroaromatic compound transport system permease small subunit